MERFFFNLRSGDEYVVDEDGDDCLNLQAAGNIALSGARELLSELTNLNRRPEHTFFEITDGNGRLRLRVPFQLALANRPRNPSISCLKRHT
jgi:hypothetical protein